MQLGAFNKATEAFGPHAPGGACPDVSQGGCMQGGGYGFTVRKVGMNCYQATSMYVMLAAAGPRELELHLR